MNISLADLLSPSTGPRTLELIKTTSDNIVSKKKSCFVCHQLQTKTTELPVDFYRLYFTQYGKTNFACNIKGTGTHYRLSKEN